MLHEQDAGCRLGEARVEVDSLAKVRQGFWWVTSGNQADSFDVMQVSIIRVKLKSSIDNGKCLV
jgi:hypothetical protein